MTGYIEQANELYKQGLIGTDDFQSVAQLISPEKICLLYTSFTKLASLYVVRVIGHPHLKFMVQTSRHTDVFLIPESLKQNVIRNSLT